MNDHPFLYSVVFLLFMKDCTNCDGYAKKYEVESSINYNKNIQQIEISRCKIEIDSLRYKVNNFESKIRSLESDVIQLQYRD